MGKKIIHLLSNLSIIASFIGICTFLYEIGYTKYTTESVEFLPIYILIALLGIVVQIVRLSNKKFRQKEKRRVILSDCLIVLLFTILIVTSLQIPTFLGIYFVPLILFIREGSIHITSFNRKHINPSKIFLASFILIIFIGTILLEMPRATPNGISFADALFTSASAVCVTGLSTLSTHSDFTFIGKCIILSLIQIGGLGIMTIVVYFVNFFRGKMTYENRMIMGQITAVDRLNEISKIIRHIVLITVIVESLGALLIFFTLPTDVAWSFRHRLFFSVFHSISAFCNAGFSTLEGGLMSPLVNQLYALHWIIACLIIIGGLGFFVIEDLIEFWKHRTKLGRRIYNSRNWYTLPTTSRLVLLTTGILLTMGTAVFLSTEWNGVLKDLPIFGKITTAFFQSTTCRTAGFNTIDISQYAIPSIIFTLFLMWVGASPASTGGGIKTTAIAVSFLTIYNMLKGRDRVQIYYKRVSRHTIYRAFSVIMLSLAVIALSTCLLSISEKNYTLQELIFEVTSAYSTVGLSLGITSGLSEIGKYIIIFTMFVGRVTMLTFLMSIFPPSKMQYYQCPNVDITIN